MFTVIIQSPETARLGQDYRRLFCEGAVEQEQIAFCTWSEDSESVKSLYELIAGRQEWRAIIVQTEEDRLKGPPARPEDPFDFLENEGQDACQCVESDIPLIRLTQLLGGVPEPEVVFEPYTVEEDGMTARMLYRSRRDEAAMEEHRRLTEKYQFFETRPKEILLLSTRQTVDNSDRELAAAWDLRLESESSEFWSRNRYPSICRFLVFDVVDPRHSLYPGSVFKLWTIVLLLALNQIQPSSLQAYRLYSISIDLDRAKLSGAFSGYLSRMAEMQKQLDLAEVNGESLESQASRQAPDVSKKVDVVFSIPDESQLFIDTSKLGLTRDVPMDERQYWSEHYWLASGAVRRLLRSPVRTLDVAADDARRRGAFPSDQVELLNDYQRADLENDMEEIYFNALEARSRLSFDVDARKREREVIDQQVHARIQRRLDRRRAAIGGLVCAGAVVLGSLSYLIGAGRTGASALLWALVALLGILLVAGGFGLAEMWIQRRVMADTMEDHNRCMNDLTTEFAASAKHYSAYLTNVCAYLRGCSYLDQERVLRTGRDDEARFRAGHRNAIAKCVSIVHDWAVALGVRILPELDEDEEGADEGFDAGVTPEENLAYRFRPRETSERDVPLNGSGESLRSPFDFIRSVKLEREELYDDVDRDRDL